MARKNTEMYDAVESSSMV